MPLRTVWTEDDRTTYNRAVKFRRFEDWLARLLEGGVARLLGAKLQPVDIAKRLVEYMEDHRTIGAGRLYVPNNYRVYLSPRTRSGFSRFESTLHDELAEYLRAYARDQDYHCVGRVRVSILADSAMGDERMRIEADLVDGSGLVLDGAGQHTEAIVMDRPADSTVQHPLRLQIGRRVVDLQPGNALRVGRALDNDLILDDSSVSRHHARLSERGGAWLLEDLASSGGTFVNGRETRSAYLRVGDVIRLGTVTLRLSAKSDEESSN